MQFKQFKQLMQSKQSKQSKEIKQIKECSNKVAVWAFCPSSGSLEWGCPSSAEVIKDTGNFVCHSSFCQNPILTHLNTT